MKTFFFSPLKGAPGNNPQHLSELLSLPPTRPSPQLLYLQHLVWEAHRNPALQQARAAWLLGGSHAASQQGGEEWVTFYRAVLFGLPFQDSAWSKSQDASRSTGQPAELSDTPRGAQPSARLLQPRVEAPKADPGGSLE